LENVSQLKETKPDNYFMKNLLKAKVQLSKMEYMMHILN